MEGVEVKISKTTKANTPYGFHYKAKGAYVQGKYIIVVGELKENNTIRIKYPKDDVELKFF
jgi:uncharacterized protein YgiM (DUF1202 family)